MRAIYALLSLGLLGSSGLGHAKSPDTPTAVYLLQQAEATAGSQHKTVLVTFSASWCGPCHLLQSFLADPVIGTILDRSFVKVPLIYGERSGDTRHQDTPGVNQLLETLHDTGTSLPLMVFLNSTGRVVVDSVRPVYGPRNIRANVGFPDGPNGIEWFTEMLQQAAPSLTSDELNTVRIWLTQHNGDKPWKPSPNK